MTTIINGPSILIMAQLPFLIGAPVLAGETLSQAFAIRMENSGLLAVILTCAKVVAQQLAKLSNGLSNGQIIAKVNSMQDLEELKKEILWCGGVFQYQNTILYLIARCESAEKDRDYYREEAELLANGLHRVEAELRELREQKPVAYRQLAKGAQKRGYTAYVYETTDLDFDGNGEPLYAAPVAQSRDSAEPSDYILMPKSLTAENGAKSLFMGEFNEQVEMTCQECADCDDDEDCIVCDGSGQYIQKVPVSWSTVKDIYSMAVSRLALSQKSNANAHSERLGRNEYGLDMGYMVGKLNVLIRDISRHQPDEAARVLARLAKVADEAVLSEPEFSQQSPAVAVPVALELLRILFDLYEDGDDCYENPDESDGYLGKAIRLDDETFKACVDVLTAAPQASAEQPENQCDGCNAGLHKTEIGLHLDFAGMPVMTCQKSRYKNKSAQDEGKV